MAELNKEQLAAVTAGDGPALVLAGAGSGKTRVIVERMYWLIEECGVDPRRLLALTFTNKAAAEMRARLAARLGIERVDVWTGTFHSFGLYFLRREIERFGRTRDFMVFDDTDQTSLMKKLVKDLPKDCARVSPREALNYISNLKQRVATPGDEKPGPPEEDAFRLLWNGYHEALRRANAVDFDDLLVLPVRLLEAHEDIRARYQRRYEHVLVDEYQDTNPAQYRMIRALCGTEGRVFVVGDEDQSIYSWRGADINNILNFQADFAGAHIFRLERNYRSNQFILDAANAVVAHNRERLGKRLWTDDKTGERPEFYIAEDAEEEARWIVERIKQSPTPYNEVAVLYRTNAQARLLEDAVRAAGIRYKVIGGIKFYSRKEIKDIVAYLRVVVNHTDDVSLRRVLNVPPRGIGSTTMEQIEDYATRRDTSLFQVLREMETDQSFSARARESVSKFAHLIDELAGDAAQPGVAELVERLLEQTGYRDYVRTSDEKDYKSRIEVVDEFVVSCHAYDARKEGRLAEYLQELSLLTDADEVDMNAPAVTLMTCHSAKGLEFEEVYLAGLEEGLLPLAIESDEPENLEEERRLCYVAMTRARKRLTLTAARERLVYGRMHEDRRISRFVQEAGRERLQMPERTKKAVPQSIPKPEAADGAALRTGTPVRHAQFGPGTVMFVQGSGAALRARIRFKSGRCATLLISKAPLEILEGGKS